MDKRKRTIDNLANYKERNDKKRIILNLGELLSQDA